MIDYQQPAAPPRRGSAFEAQRTPGEQQSGGGREYLVAAESWVRAHPAAALGVAFFAGAGLGWVVKRR
jgi:ElaB/YqjD/DUF883 family membrane-anchored ribosome-binding protein